MTTTVPSTDENTTTTTEPARIDGEALSDRRSNTSMHGTFDDAVSAAVAATEVTAIGDHGVAVRVPSGYSVDQIDVRQFEDWPRHRSHTQSCVGVPSFALYVNDHTPTTGDLVTRIYLRDVYGRGLELLTQDDDLARAHLDDFAADGAVLDPKARQHAVVLVTRPTAAARRWGAALSSPRLTQEEFLDLVVDGIAEIAAPDAADLRDLISNLHAARKVDVKSVKRTGGTGSIELADSVELKAGAQSIDFPEQLTIVLQPFAANDEIIMVPVRVVPAVDHDTHTVSFTLTAPGLDDQLARVISTIAADITESTGITPLWTP